MTFPPLAQIAGYEYRVNEGSAVDVGMDTDALIAGLKSDTDQKGEVRSYDTFARRGRWSPPAIARTFLLTDDFNDGVLDPARWTAPFYSGAVGGMSVVEQSGMLRLKSLSPWVGNSQCGLYGALPMDFRGKRIEIDVPAVLGTSGGSTLALYGAGYVQIYYDGIFGFQMAQQGGGATTVQLPFPAGTTKWAIEHHADVNRWEFLLYINGVWQSQFISAVANWTPNPVTLGISAYTYGGGTAGTSFDIDNLVGKRSASPPFLMIDDFNDGVIDATQWSPYTFGGPAVFTVTEQGGRLHIQSPAVPNVNFSGGGVHSVPPIDMTGRSLEFDHFTPTAYAALLSIYTPAYPNGISIGLAADGSATLSLNNVSAADASHTVVANAAIRRWRIQHNATANTWTFYSFQNGIWVQEFQAAADFMPTTCLLDIQGGSYGGQVPNGVFEIDNFLIR